MTEDNFSSEAEIGKGQAEPCCFDREGHIDEIAQLEIKRRRTKKILETIRIADRPKGMLTGEYKVSSGTYDHQYSVLVRDAQALEQSTCNCPDYLINELGTCKHIELVNDHITKKMRGKTKLKRNDNNIWISIKPRNSFKAGISPLEEIHLHANDAKILSTLFSKTKVIDKPWSDEGYLYRWQNSISAQKQYEHVIKKIDNCFPQGKAPKIVVSIEVEKMISDLDGQSKWEERIDKILASPHSSSEWNRVVGDLPVRLYDYQKEGILFAIRNRRVFIGDDMGLGKTVQAIVAATIIRRIEGIKKVLIFAPASLKHQWKREIEKMTREDVQIVTGQRKERGDIYLKSSATFLIVNYELIFRDEEFFHVLKPDMIILDEAQRIKNWETKTAKGIKRLKSKFAIVLTGTPFENKLIELHSLCEFLHPRALGPMWRLMPAHANLDAHDKVTGYSNLSGIRKKISPFFIRRERATVLSELPEKITNQYVTEISSAQLSYHNDYQATLAKTLSKLKIRPLTPAEIKRVLMCLNCMRIVSNALAQHDWEKYKPIIENPSPLSSSEIRNFHSPKLLEFRAVMEDLLEKPDCKFVIFSQWERMLKLAQATLRDVLLKKKIDSVIFSGSMPVKLRSTVIDRFISDPKLRIFFSTDAGGVGLNLQESASFVINLEMPWNPAVLNQRISRVHRLGQKNTVNVINFISSGCIEERVYDAVCNKGILFDGVFDGKTDDITFEKGSDFISRLKTIMGDDLIDSAKDEGVIDREKEEIIEEKLKAVEADGNIETKAAPQENATVKSIDLTNIMRAVGSWLGDDNLKNLKPGLLNLRMEDDGDEINLKITKPPKELITGIKDVLSGLFK